MNAQEKAIRDAEIEAEAISETEHEEIASARAELAARYAGRVLQFTSLASKVAPAASVAGAFVLTFTSLVHS